jgi:peptidoglycan hydrolase CwlO-like protein
MISFFYCFIHFVADILIEKEVISMASDLQMIMQAIKELGMNFISLDQKIDKLGLRIDKLDQRMDKLEGRMDRIETRMDDMEQNMKSGFATLKQYY